MPLDDPRPITAATRFRLDCALGKGSSGVVFRAYDALRGEWIALKYLTALDPGSLVRFKSEFRKLATLSHRNLLQLHELLTVDERWLLTMELIDGKNLLAHLRPQSVSEVCEEPDCDTTVIDRDPTEAHDTLPAPPAPERVGVGLGNTYEEPELRRTFCELAEGLNALHLAGKLHRDLKPANVLVASADGRVVICDFGLALEESADVELALAADAVGAPSAHRFAQRRQEVAGTPAYMSPEQTSGQTLTPASDWYSVGVMLYQVLTGRVPFDPTLGWEAALRVKQTFPPTDPRAFDSACPPQLAELALALLAADPGERPGYEQVVAVLAGGAGARESGRKSSVFVGRAAQREELRRALEQSRDGAASLALVSGSSGMGKSALIRRFLLAAERETNALVLRARCYEREELPYKAVDPLIDAIAAHLLEQSPAAQAALVPASVRYLAALFPALRQVPYIAELHASIAWLVDPRERRRHALLAFRELCTRLARERPLVLFIDDLQWGDADSAMFLQALVAPPEPPPVLVVCAYRSEAEQRSPLLRKLREAHALDPAALRLLDVVLGPLSPEESEQLARLTLGASRDAAKSAAMVAREAAGSPFFVAALASFARERGLEAARSVRLEELLDQQLAALSPAARNLLSLIALSGQPIALRTLRAAADDALAPRALRELEGQRLVTSVRQRGDDWFEAAHDRIREAACRTLEGTAERALHRALASAYEAEAEADVDALRRHWLGAGEREAALRYTLLGAEAAERALAFARASELYRQALTLSADDEARTRELEDRLARVLIFAGRGAEAAALFLKLVPYADRARALEYRMLASTQLLRSGKMSAGFAELERARDVFGVRLPRTTARSLIMLLSRKLRIRLRELRLRLGPVRPEDDPEAARLRALWEVSAALTSADFLRGSVYGAELTLRALRLKDPVHIAGAAGLEAIAAAAASDMRRLASMRALSRRAAASAPNDHELLGRVLGMESIAHWLVGEWRDCVRLAAEAEERLRRGQRLVWDLAMVTYWGLAGAAYLGDLGVLFRRVPEMVRDAEARGDSYAATSFRTHMNTWAWLASDRPDLAEHHADVAERTWTPDGYQFQKWHMTFSRAETALYCGTAAEALARIEREWDAARFVRFVASTDGDMRCARARLALALAGETRRPELVRKARSDGLAMTRIRVPYSRAFGKLALGEVAALESRARAIELFAEAESTFATLGMRLHAGAARVRRAELTGGPAGDDLAEVALVELRALGARRPELFVRMLAPRAR